MVRSSYISVDMYRLCSSRSGLGVIGDCSETNVGQVERKGEGGGGTMDEHQRVLTEEYGSSRW